MAGDVMYELTGRIKDIFIDYFSKQANLTISVDNFKSATACYDELKDCEKLSIKIGKFRKKRSLDANAYFWVLADRLAEKLNITKEEVYKNAIRNIGGVSEIICIKNEAVEKFCNSWKNNGIGWQTETFKSKFEGCTNVIVYFGSSTYDTKQMSLLIDNIVQDCKEQGIEVRPAEEIERLLDMWDGKK